MSPPAGLPGKVAFCGLCGSWNLKPVLDMGEQPLPERYGSDERYPLALLECKACTLVQLSYIAPPREVFAEDHAYATGNTKALRDHFAVLAGEIAPMLAPGDLVIDLGCNDGTFLDAVRREAPEARLLGIEPTRQAEKCVPKDIDAYQMFFTAEVGREVRTMHGPAKVVTACNVLAHMPSAHDFAAGVARLLADDGVFIAEVHDVASILDGLQVDTVYAEHNFYWSITTLSRLLGMHGLVVTDVAKIPTHGGSFRVTARRQKTHDLDARARQAAGFLGRLLEIASESGQVYGIGACTRATPLIHYAGIASYLECVCEVPGSGKIGTCMPGTQIPVVDEARLIADQPPHALLFAWHWADSIIPKLRARGYQGKFIIPLPQARIADG